MNKKILIMAAMLIAALGMQAQEEKKSQWAVKPMVGATLNNIVGSGIDDSYKFGVAAGAEVLFQPKELRRLSLSCGLLYMMQGANEKNDFYKVKGNFSYLNLPVLVNFEIVKGLKVKAGMQLGYLLSASASADNYGMTIEQDIKYAMKPWYFSIPVGISYELPFGLVADFRYHIGITDVERSQISLYGYTFDNVGSRGHHSTFMLTLGYQIKW